MGIPARRGTRPTRHIDTELLRALVDEEDDPDLCKGMRHLSNDTSVNLAVSMMAVGEAFTGMGTFGAERSGKAASEWSRLRRGRKIRVSGLGNRDEVTNLALRLMAADSHLKPADAFILATAFMDEKCNLLYTTDRVMLESLTLQSIAREHHTDVREPPRLRR